MHVSNEAATRKNDITELVFLLDRSGSMMGLEADTIGGYNALIKQHQQQEGQAVISTVLFDHETLVVHDRVDIRSIAQLSNDDYTVRGTTALLDAVGGSIKHISMVQRYLPEAYKPSKTIVVITTDGMENASTRYTYDDVKRMIGERELNGWEFLFLGANIDAAAEAGKMGIPATRATRYVADDRGTEVLYQAVANATCVLRSEQSLPDDWCRTLNLDSESRG